MSLYKIVIETTNNKTKAQDHVTNLNHYNIPTDIEPLNLDNQTFYQVLAGPYSMKKNALQDVDKIKNLGLKQAFITSS